MFNISKYYELIKRVKGNKIAIYTIYAFMGYFIGSIFTSILTMTKNKSIMPTIIGIIIGLFIAYQHTLTLDIKIQKMYWEIDVYNKLNKIIDNKEK